MEVRVKKTNKDAIIPEYKTRGAACFDLHVVEEKEIQPGDTTLVGTGLSFAIPDGYEMQVRPRSGVSLKTDIHLKNSPGTIDSDYRGEVFLIVANRGVSPVKIEKFERIAQASIQPIMQVTFKEVEFLDETERGAGGFGSTGK